jgi:O26-antigen biosynthesis N-acetyl-L-fucosamine transferase
MKVCIIVDDYMPYSIKVAAKMMHELAVEFIAQRHQVSVLTPNSTQKDILVSSVLDGVNVYSFKSGEIKNVNKIKRAINETLLSYNAYKAYKTFVKENHHDLIIYYSPSIFFGSFVKKLKNIWNVPSYLILRDIFPQWAIDNGILKESSMITKYFKYFEKINYDAADTIGVMSKKNLEWFQEYYTENKKIEILYNWADNKAVTHKTNKYRKQLNIEDKIVYFYGGNLGHAQDMMNIIRLAINMKKYTQAHFVLVGAGDEYELIEKEINNKNLNNITLLSSVNQDEYKQMLSEFDIGLFTLNKNHKTHNFPGKLLGYMVQKLPILGSINPDNDLKDVVEEYNAGYVTVNGEDELFLNNAIKLLDENHRKNIGNNANDLLKDKFSVEFSVQQILNKKGE